MESLQRPGDMISSSSDTSQNAQVPPVAIAIVGCGAITERYHLPAALRSPAVELRALVDIQLGNAQRLARRYALHCKLASNLADVLDDAEGVIIAAPNSAHFELASLALARGIPVLVEKPITNTYAEAEQLCQLAEKRGTFISVGYWKRRTPSVRLMKDLLETGYFGKVESFHYEFGAVGGWETVSGYSLSRQLSGGGVLIDTGCHFIDRMHYWFGEPTSFKYWDDSYGGVESTCFAEVLYDTERWNFRGTILLSKAVRLKNCFRLESGIHSCTVGETQRTTITVAPRETPEIEYEISPRADRAHPAKRDYFQEQLEEFASIIRNGGHPTVDGSTGALVTKLVEQMYSQRRQLEEPWLLYRSKVGRHHA